MIFFLKWTLLYESCGVLKTVAECNNWEIWNNRRETWWPEGNWAWRTHIFSVTSNAIYKLPLPHLSKKKKIKKLVSMTFKSTSPWQWLRFNFQSLTCEITGRTGFFQLMGNQTLISHTWKLRSLSMTWHIFNPSNQKAETGRSWVQGQAVRSVPEQALETPFLKKKKKKKRGN